MRMFAVSKTRLWRRRPPDPPDSPRISYSAANDKHNLPQELSALDFKLKLKLLKTI
jgi:hypothetical protein